MMGSLAFRQRRIVAAIAISLAVVSLTGTAAGPVLGLTPTACRVKNLDTGVVRGNLQGAVDAASPGHRLTLRGTCIGKTTIDRSLQIRGIRPQGAGKPIIDAQDAGTVIVVSAGVTVTLEDLAVTGGSSTGTPSGRGAPAPAGGTIGGGIHNDGTLDLRTVVVRGNDAIDGGGIWNKGALRLLEASVVRSNHGIVNGGGILNEGTLRMRGTSAVRRNTAGSNGGGVYNHTGSILVLRDLASVALNGAGGNGGGIYAYGESTVTLRGRSSIAENEAASNGGGVFAHGTLLTLKGTSVVTGNAAVRGAGVYNFGGSTTALEGGATISGNTASDDAGGIYSTRSSVVTGAVCGTDPDGNVHDNEPQDCVVVSE